MTLSSLISMLMILVTEGASLVLQIAKSPDISKGLLEFRVRKILHACTKASY
jgi:hypothetical protein